MSFKKVKLKIGDKVMTPDGKAVILNLPRKYVADNGEISNVEVVRLQLADGEILSDYRTRRIEVLESA